jgi:hypothetical protein
MVCPHSSILRLSGEPLPSYSSEKFVLPSYEEVRTQKQQEVVISLRDFVAYDAQVLILSPGSLYDPSNAEGSILFIYFPRNIRVFSIKSLSWAISSTGHP